MIVDINLDPHGTRDDLVAIASDKFGTHVLCRAIAVKELEVGDAFSEDERYHYALVH